MFFFVVLVIEKIFVGKMLKKMHVLFQHIYTIILLLVSWTIFAIEDMGHLSKYLKVMFGFGKVAIWNDFETYNLKNYGMILFMCIFSSTPILKLKFQKLPEKFQKILTVFLLGVSLLICTAYLVAGTYNPFLYFRF